MVSTHNHKVGYEEDIFKIYRSAIGVIIPLGMINKNQIKVSNFISKLLRGIYVCCLIDVIDYICIISFSIKIDNYPIIFIDSQLVG